MRSAVGADGQVTLPLELLRGCGILPGDEVAFRREDDHIVVEPVTTDSPLRGRFASRPLAALLEEERATERSRGALT